jgi:hypothetical protein
VQPVDGLRAGLDQFIAVLDQVRSVVIASFLSTVCNPGPVSDVIRGVVVVFAAVSGAQRPDLGGERGRHVHRADPIAAAAGSPPG